MGWSRPGILLWKKCGLKRQVKVFFLIRESIDAQSMCDQVHHFADVNSVATTNVCGVMYCIQRYKTVTRANIARENSLKCIIWVQENLEIWRFTRCSHLLTSVDNKCRRNVGDTEFLSAAWNSKHEGRRRFFFASATNDLSTMFFWVCPTLSAT